MSTTMALTPSCWRVSTFQVPGNKYFSTHVSKINLALNLCMTLSSAFIMTVYGTLKFKLNKINGWKGILQHLWMLQKLVQVDTHRWFHYPRQFHACYQRSLDLTATPSHPHVFPSAQYCNMGCCHPETRVNVGNVLKCTSNENSFSITTYKTSVISYLRTGSEWEKTMSLGGEIPPRTIAPPPISIPP